MIHTCFNTGKKKKTTALKNHIKNQIAWKILIWTYKYVTWKNIFSSLLVWFLSLNLLEIFMIEKYYKRQSIVL